MNCSIRGKWTIAIAVIFGSLVAACSAPGQSGSVSSDLPVVEITDLFQTGFQRFNEHLQEDSVLNQVWLGRREQTVMVLIDIEWEDGDLEQAQQSGIILNQDGLILSAGHGFIIEDGTILEVRARTIHGDEVVLTPLGYRYDKAQVPVIDWALLQAEELLPYEAFKPFTAPRDRNKMMVLGYPAALGLTIDEHVAYVREMGSETVMPLGLICNHHIVDQHTLFAKAGAIPLRGISGAPIFNRNGELVGIFSSIGRRRTIKGWGYIFGMADIPWTSIQSLSSK